MSEKKSFILYTDNRSQINMLSDQQAGRLFKALFAFAESGDIPAFEDGMTTMAFSFISAQIKRDSDKYDDVCKKRSENGKKGGRPSEKAKKPNVFFEKQNKQTKAKKLIMILLLKMEIKLILIL